MQAQPPTEVTEIHTERGAVRERSAAAQITFPFSKHLLLKQSSTRKPRDVSTHSVSDFAPTCRIRCVIPRGSARPSNRWRIGCAACRLVLLERFTGRRETKGAASAE